MILIFFAWAWFWFWMQNQHGKGGGAILFTDTLLYICTCFNEMFFLKKNTQLKSNILCAKFHIFKYSLLVGTQA